MDGLSDEDKKKLESYLQGLDRPDETQQLMEQWKNRNLQALDVAARGAETPEEQALIDQEVGPLMQGLMQGGTMGAVKTVGQSAIKQAFPQLKQMITVSGRGTGAKNMAEAIKAAESMPKSPYGRVILK